ncbi:MAG: tRNA uridine-5-carboxymethylaminomethyl(34) synthesis GTPase MnmE [Puniceicoccales bacterium]|nr:tRNA uridine-5-carboxymethylaminomethyl(34) synthesis GTPase MnmE [Puniceicoccales bacterium]
MRRDTIVALATPAGTSAICVLRASGSLCERLLGSFRGNREFLPNCLCHREYFSVDGCAIDDVLVVFFRAPKSYTGEDSIEIHCHGNMLLADRILSDMCARGCRLADPGEFTKRAFLSGKLDLCQAEAVADIIHAASDRAIAVARKQLSGTLSDRINAISGSLIDPLAAIEHRIDFSDGEDDSAAFWDDTAREVAKISSALEELMRSSRFRNAIDGGISLVILGEPNVGKSSLFNALLGEDRAIVSEIPGTTRDIISEKIVIGGNALRICDSAGLRSGNTACGVEKIGIEKAISLAKNAEIFLIVVDASADRAPEFPQELTSLFGKKNSLVAMNRIDLGKNCNLDNFLPHVRRVTTSINIPESIGTLRENLLSVISENDALRCDVDIVVNARHVEILRRALEFLSSAALWISRKSQVEIIASDIRQALETLGEITGAYGHEKILDAIFSNFCVGK